MVLLPRRCCGKVCEASEAERIRGSALLVLCISQLHTHTRKHTDAAAPTPGLRTQNTRRPIQAPAGSAPRYRYRKRGWCLIRERTVWVGGLGTPYHIHIGITPPFHHKGRRVCSRPGREMGVAAVFFTGGEATPRRSVVQYENDICYKWPKWPRSWIHRQAAGLVWANTTNMWASGTLVGSPLW